MLSDLTAERLSAEASRASLDPAPTFLPETSSTNTALRERAAVAVHGTCVIAGHQTAGRGRRGRTWLAPPEHALALSVLLRPALPLSRLPLVVLAAGVAVVEACGPAFRLKWPNDVLDLEGRKVCGILAEADVRAEGGLDWVIVGIGLNVGGAPEGPFRAGCLAEVLDEAPDRSGLAVDIVRRLRERVALLEEDPAAVLAAWRQRDGTLGRRVRVEGIEGVAVGLGPDGALEVQDDAGRRHRILAGDVEMVKVG